MAKVAPSVGWDPSFRSKAAKYAMNVSMSSATSLQKTKVLVLRGGFMKWEMMGMM